MDIENNSSPAGSLKISQDVLVSIARFATLEIDGVESVSTGNLGVKGLITKTNYIKPIKVELSEDIVNVTVSIIVQHGTKISAVAEAVQQNVKSAIQSMIGMAVARVDVVVAGIAILKEEQPAR